MSFTIAEVEAPQADSWRMWTFPAYRHLLDPRPQPRRLAGADRRVVRPIALAAVDEDGPCGFVLGCVPHDRQEPGLEMSNDPELLSVQVAQRARRRGIATALIGRLEESVRNLGFLEIHVVYMTGRPDVHHLERALRTRGWSPPATRMVVVRGTLETALAQPWIRHYKPEWGFELFRWVDLGPEEIERLKASYQESGWIAEDLRPWHYDASTLEPGSSLGIRLRGEIVGWVINHRLDARTVRFTCSFLRRDLARFARILPAYSESIRRAHDAGFEQVVFTVPVHHREMVDFVRRRCMPNGAELSETRGASKALAVPHASPS